MIGLVREAYSAVMASLTARKAMSRAMEEAYSSLSFKYGGSHSQPYQDDESPLSLNAHDVWRMMGQQASAINYATLKQAQAEARLMYRIDPFAKNVVTQIVNHTVGRGFTVSFDDEVQEEAWKSQTKELRWSKRRREIVRRKVRDGEAFVRKFDDGIRFVEPEHVAPLSGRETDMPFGVLFAEDDVETPVAYGIHGEEVSADEVLHFKTLDSDLDEARGWPTLFDAKGLFDNYRYFLNDRGLLNRFRSTILMFRKHAGVTGAEIKKFHDAIKSGNLSSSDGKSRPFDLFSNRGRTIDHPSDVEYEFKNPNTGAMDASEDGRAMRLLPAVFYSLPEYVMTSDASNANYASTAVAEAPGVKAMEAWQEDVADDFHKLIAWVLGVDDLTINFVFPPLVSRDEMKTTQARVLRYQNGVLSASTWMEMDGLDPAVELAKINADL